MELNEILERIEELLEKEKKELMEAGDEQSSTITFLKEILLLLFQFVVALLKAPFRLVAGYVKKEVISAIKKDSKIMAFISAMLIVLLVFFLVLWMSVSVAVGAYFYDKGYSLFASVVYSVAFQVVSILVVILISYLISRNLKTFKLFKSLTGKNR
ncbi:MAG: hypothetical protein GXO47_02620 [Chlorobi bacterium]|nr:hypothetical protein [Chlorobiota bacterium]